MADWTLLITCQGFPSAISKYLQSDAALTENFKGLSISAKSVTTLGMRWVTKEDRKC